MSVNVDASKALNARALMTMAGIAVVTISLYIAMGFFPSHLFALCPDAMKWMVSLNLALLWYLPTVLLMHASFTWLAFWGNLDKLAMFMLAGAAAFITIEIPLAAGFLLALSFEGFLMWAGAVKAVEAALMVVLIYFLKRAARKTDPQEKPAG